MASTYCLARIDHSVCTMSPDSSSVKEDVKAAAPTIEYDNQAKEYYVIADWDWQNLGFMDDGANLFSPYTKNLGGPDGFGISFNTSLLMAGWSASWWGNCHYGTSTSSTASSGNQYGAGFKFQDQDYATNSCFGLNTYHGDEVISFTHTQTKKCQNVQAYTKYGHSWSSTSLTGFSIGLYSVGMSWSTSSNQWEASSQPGGVATVC